MTINQHLEVILQGTSRSHRALNDRESVLHEVCHLVTLRIPDPDDAYLESHVASFCNVLTAKAADHNEISTLACEYHILKRTGLLKVWYANDLATYLDDVIKVEWQHYSQDQAEARLLRAIETKIARQRATTAIRRVRRFAQKLKEGKEA